MDGCWIGEAEDERGDGVNSLENKPPPPLV